MILRLTKEVIKLLLLILIFLYPPVQVKAQNECTAALERAENLFDQGIIEEIPVILAGCLKNGFSREDKMRAQKLMILSYLFDNKIEEAEKTILNFLDDNPEYKIKSTDPAEFASLFSRFRTIPYLSAGVLIGGNLSLPHMLEQYGPFNSIREKGTYSYETIDFQIGAGLNFFLGNSLELNIESLFIRNSFVYSNLQYGFAQIYKKETYQKFEFPVSLSLDLGKGRWKPYLRMGGSYGIIMHAESNYEREYINTGSAYYSPLETYGINISERRKEYSFSAVGGGGIKYKIPRGHLYFDIRYFYSLTHLVIPDNRWEDELIYTYYHADSDFIVDYLTFSVGLRYSFYKSKKL